MNPENVVELLKWLADGRPIDPQEVLDAFNAIVQAERDRAATLVTSAFRGTQYETVARAIGDAIKRGEA